MRLSDRVDDGEPQPDPAVRAGPRGIGSGEALEDLPERVRIDAAALVVDLDARSPAPLRARAELDRVRVSV